MQENNLPFHLNIFVLLFFLLIIIYLHITFLNCYSTDNDSDKENLPGKDGYYPDYDNLPGDEDSDDDDSSSDDGDIHYIDKDPSK